MKRVLVWGTGGRAETLMSEVPESGVEIAAFVDNNPSRQGRAFHGRPVVSPGTAAGMDFDALIIASVFYNDIKRQALGLGIAEGRIQTYSYLYFAGLDGRLPNETLRRLCSVPVWYHSFEILPGVTTPGMCRFKPELLAPPMPADMHGLDVLDIGAWDGAYTLEMSRRGARVTAFDIQPAVRTGFDVMRSLNRLDSRHICANVYDLDPGPHGTYDLVTFFGVYYHLRNPLAALANINGVLRAGGLLFTEGAVLEGAPVVDAAWADRAEEVRRMASLPLAAYIKGGYEGENSNWWVPNLSCLRDWHESCGFEILRAGLSQNDTRAFVVARKAAEVPAEHPVLGRTL